MTSEANALPEEIRHVPLWVKGMVAGGAILFLIQLPSFTSSLSDAIQKNSASADFDRGEYVQAADKYKALHARYPADQKITKELAFAQYRAGLYVDTLKTFDQLAGVKMTKKEVDEINAVISDVAAKLDLKTE